MDKDKLVKWINEEIYGCKSRGETERENAMSELLLKIERGYFDKNKGPAEAAESTEIYSIFYPLITCSSCLLVTKNWAWVENHNDEQIYGVCLDCKEKAKEVGLTVFHS